MSSRQGGKLKPKKAPKKEKPEKTEEEKAFDEKRKEEERLLKKAQQEAKSKNGPLVGGGIKKSGKK